MARVKKGWTPSLKIEQLVWPNNIPKTSQYERENGNARYTSNYDFVLETIDNIRDQLRLFEARNVIILFDLNIDPSLPKNGISRFDLEKFNGIVYSSKYSPAAGIKFDVTINLNGKEETKTMFLVQDKYANPAHNLRSLSLAIKSLRVFQENAQTNMMSFVFNGLAIEAPRVKPWYEIIGCKETDTAEEIKAAYRRRAKNIHTDTGGTDGQMAELNVAMDAAREIKGFN